MNTQIKINHTPEPLYTISEAHDILTWEQRKHREIQLEKRMYFVKQKLCGITMIILSIVVLFFAQYSLDDSDMGIGACIFALIGLWLLFTHERVMRF